MKVLQKLRGHQMWTLYQNSLYHFTMTIIGQENLAHVSLSVAVKLHEVVLNMVVYAAGLVLVT